MSEALEKIREVRNLENPKLKPSPYLKKYYTDEYGDQNEIHIRDYQIRGIMNLCMVPRTILADQTGLGKTLQLLTSIAYIWVKEPNYIPIIITKKSSLYQWAAEVNKFMQNMEAVVVDGEPYQRHLIYEDFFLGFGTDNKRLLMLTYDMLLKDIERTVIKNKENKPSLEIRKQLAKEKEKLKQLEDQFQKEKSLFQIYFDNRPSTHEYLRSVFTNTQIVQPVDWNLSDDERLRSFLKIKTSFNEAKQIITDLKNQIAPPKEVPGLIDYVKELLVNNSEARFIFVLDEAHTIKNYRGKIHAAAEQIAAMSERVVAMTATPVKNRLMEFFSIFRVIQPSLFPQISKFQNEFCVTKLQSIKGNRKVPIVIGYKNLDRFVQVIEPYYLSRKKQEVAKELPQLINRELICVLSDEQEELYDIAEMGLLNKNFDDEENTVLSSLVMVQQAANAPQLLSNDENKPFEGTSTKVEVIIDNLLNELEGTKTIIFSRFEKMISLLGSELGKNQIKYVRITGKENTAKERLEAMNRFQDGKSGVDVILITTAGSESINLQAAEHIIFIDSPWSMGDYIQLIGRAIRIGSKHKAVVATHLIAKKKSGKNTIDHHVLKILRQKKKLIDKVAGESLEGGLEFQKEMQISDLFNAIKNDANPNQNQNQMKKIHSTTTKKSKLKETTPSIVTLDVDFSDI